MQLAIGKYYRTRSGKKVGPAESYRAWSPYSFLVPVDGVNNIYRGNGKWGCEDIYGDNPKDLDIVAEWIDPNKHNPYGSQNHPLPPKKEEQPPRKWAELTDYEKGSLLLAHQEGKDIQLYRTSVKDWQKTNKPIWGEKNSYRVKPEHKVVVEKKRGTMVFHDGVMVEGSWRSEEDIYKSED